MNVLMISAELAPLAKTGGLADAVTGLSDALAARGHDVRVLLPKYEHLPPAGRRRAAARGSRRRATCARARRAESSPRTRWQEQTRHPDRLSARSRGAHAGTDLLWRRPRRGPLHSARGSRRRLARGARLAPRRAALPRLARGARAARAALPCAGAARADGPHVAQHRLPGPVRRLGAHALRSRHDPRPSSHPTRSPAARSTSCARVYARPTRSRP